MPRETSDRGGIARTDVEGEAGSGVIAVAAVRSSHPSRPSVLERIVHRAVQILFLCYEVSRLNTVTQTARRGSTSQHRPGLFKPVAHLKVAQRSWRHADHGHVESGLRRQRVRARLSSQLAHCAARSTTGNSAAVCPARPHTARAGGGARLGPCAGAPCGRPSGV
jgi:hypothetical protein